MNLERMGCQDGSLPAIPTFPTQGECPLAAMTYERLRRVGVPNLHFWLQKGDLELTDQPFSSRSSAPGAAARSWSIFDASLPPASAKSARPPPPPPTIGASSLTSRPACTRDERSLETETTRLTLPSFSDASTTTPLESRSRSESEMPRRALFSSPATRFVNSCTPATSTGASACPLEAPAPAPSAAFILRFSTSRASRLLSD